MKIGTRGSKIIEPQALTAPIGRKVVWRKQKVDPAELAKLRWVGKMTVEGLMSHFGKSKTGIKKALRQLKKREV